jgi:hypothetical protein
VGVDGFFERADRPNKFAERKNKRQAKKEAKVSWRFCCFNDTLKTNQASLVIVKWMDRIDSHTSN